MVDETNKNECKAPAPLSPSSFSGHDRSRQQDPVPRGRPDPDTPSSLAADDFDFEGPSSSPPSHVPSLGSSFADEAKGRGKHQAEIRRAFDLISRHYHRQLGHPAEDLECCRIYLDPEAYSQLKESLHGDLLAHFENNLRHDYSPQRGCLKLRLMVTPLHETFKSRFIDEIKAQLSGIASRLENERASIQPQHSTARATALEETVRVISELEDLSHTTVILAGGGSACPDGQFRHKSRIPHFVFEIGYSEEATSLRQSAEDYINNTYDVKTVVTVDTAYTREQKRKALLRKRRGKSTSRQAAVESVDEAQAALSSILQPPYMSQPALTKPAEQDTRGPAPGVERELDSEGQQQAHQDQSQDLDVDTDPDKESINRCATLCLYRGTRTIIRDAMIRNRHGKAQDDGTLILSLDDFISDETVHKLEDLYPLYDQEPNLIQFHPSALLIPISFGQLTAMLEKGDEHQDIQDTTPPPGPDPRPKRKLCFEVDNSSDDISTTTGVKRRRVIAVGTRPRTRSMSGHAQNDE